MDTSTSSDPPATAASACVPNPGGGSTPVPATDVCSLGRPATRAEVLEQVMRLTDDDLLLLPFLTVSPGTAAAAGALGRLLVAAPVRLVDRCPLVSFTTGRPVDPRWRDWYPPREGSLWSLLTFYRQMYGLGEAGSAVDLLAELEDLRVRAAADLPAFEPGTP